MKARDYGAIRSAVRRAHLHDVPPAARPDWRGLWELRKSQWVESVWIAMMRDPYRQRYLYLIPTDGSAWGQLITVLEGEPPPAGAELACTERIPSGDQATIRRWLDTFAARLSVIPRDL